MPPGAEGEAMTTSHPTQREPELAHQIKPPAKKRNATDGATPAVPTLADALRDLADKLHRFSSGIDSNHPPDPLDSASGFRDLFALVSITLGHSHGPERQDREAIEYIGRRAEEVKARYREAWRQPVAGQFVTVKRGDHKGDTLRLPDARVHAAESLASDLLRIAAALGKRAQMIDARTPPAKGTP